MTRAAAYTIDAASASKFAAPGARGAIDSLVQGSLVELFAAHQVAVAPLPRSSALRVPSLPDVSVTVAFSYGARGEQTGRLTLSMPSAVLEQMRGPDGTAVKLDWARELGNQLMGRIKNRLLPFDLRLTIGALAALDSTALERQLQNGGSVRLYTARSLRGNVVVTLQGLPEEYKLVYVGAPPAAEGSLIFF
jgi:hypothetical protein